MLMNEFEIDELRRAYQLLDVPYSTSERSIKQAYRRVLKRWHPDRYASGTPAHTEATQMMKLINEAYSQIENAPLRYYDEQTAAPRRQTGSEAGRSPDPYADNPYVTDIETRSERLGRRIGACFRFVAGGVFGAYALWPFHAFLRIAGHPLLAVVLVTGAFLGGGFAMVRYGKNIPWGRW
jgi:DnaJ-class molecular chaperone